MSKYSIGDRFVIEISEIYESKSKAPRELYRMCGFRSLIFDESGLDKLEMVKEPCKAAADNEEIEIGDEVENYLGRKSIVTQKTCDGHFVGMTKEGNFVVEGKESIKRTGRKLNMADVLDWIGGKA